MKRLFRNLCLASICSLTIWLGWHFSQQATSANNPEKILHTVSRLSYGVTPGQLEQVAATGLENYIQSQLNPESIPENSLLDNRLEQLDTIASPGIQLWRDYRVYERRLNAKGADALSIDAREQVERQRNQLRRRIAQQARQAHVARAVFSSRQLQEVMTDFWFNHFNVYANKKNIRIWIDDYANQIRQLALGDFRDLLGMTARHPAMLMYLDNELNTDPKSTVKFGNARGFNENYARELMELHTLGVDGGYTQADVKALTRIFTGWGLRYNPKPEDTSGFRFFSRRHDNTTKTFLGKTIPGNGMAEGEQALDMLASHPATARFISYKLAQYFVSDRPPESLVNQLAQTFTSSNGNIKTVLDTLFHSVEFNDPQYYRAKFTTPLQYVASVIRASDIKNFKLNTLVNNIGFLGMPIYNCGTPDGYKNTESAWLSPDAMLRRLSFATNVANGQLNKKQKPNWQQLQQTLGNNLTPKTQKAIAQKPDNLKSAMILGSPEMMYR